MDAGGIWINTFHAACVRILRMYSHLIGYDNYFSIYDTDDQKKSSKLSAIEWVSTPNNIQKNSF
ncbi:MAG: UvrD-helicase domain-containing protein [Lachnospiraceae bacterium]|nr:UvrD-helicase domain-containing protein [Lachnospiraceae bacterium]